MEKRHLTISVSTGTIIKTIVILALAWAIYALQHLVLLVLTAIVIASAIEPGVARMHKRKIPRTLAVLLIYLAILSLLFVLFVFFIPSVLTDFSAFISALPGYLQDLTHGGLVQQYSQLLGIAVPDYVTMPEIVEGVTNGLNLTATFSNIFTAVSTFFGGIFSFLIIVIFSFYLAVIETGVDDFLRIIVPKNHQSYALGLWRRSQHKIGLWMQGQLLLGIIIGVIIFLLLTIFQIPHALVLAVIAGVCEIIPVFGPTISAIPGVVVAFGTGGATLGIIAICIYLITQQFENHLIGPLVVTRIVGVPPLLIILSLIIGGQLAGFLGIILAAPLASVVQELARDIESGRFLAHEREAEKNFV